MSEAVKYINPIITSYLHSKKLQQDSEEAKAQQQIQRDQQAQADKHFQATHDLEKSRFEAEQKYREAQQLLNSAHMKAQGAQQTIENVASGAVSPTETVDNSGAMSNGLVQSGAANFPEGLISHNTPQIDQDVLNKFTTATAPNSFDGSSVNVPTPAQIGANRLKLTDPVAKRKSELDLKMEAAKIEGENQKLAKQGENARALADINNTASMARTIYSSGEAFKRTKYNADRRSTDAKLDRTLAEEHRRTDAEVKMHDANPITKNFVVLSQLKNFVNSMPDDTKSPTDDQGLIYGFAKGMDPSGTVKEGEYATVKKYSQSWADQLGVNLGRVLDNGGLLTPEARKLMKATIAAKVDATEREYADYRSGIAGRIDRKVGRAGAGEEALGSYQGGSLTSKPVQTTKQETNSAGGVLDPIMTKKKGYKVYRSE